MNDLYEPPRFWKPSSSEDRASWLPSQRLDANVQKLCMHHIIRVPVHVFFLYQSPPVFLFFLDKPLNNNIRKCENYTELTGVSCLPLNLNILVHA